MSLEKALVEELNNNVGVGTRIWPLVLPPGSRKEPAITYTRVSTRSYPCFGKDANLKTPRMQLDCYAPDYPDAVAVAEAVEGRLGDKTGILGLGSQAIGKVAIVPSDEAHSYEEETKLYRVRLEFWITYER